MLRLSKKTLLAVEAVVDIAYNGGDQPVQSRDITRRQGITKRYLERVLQTLVRAGILTSTRGPKGGYRLARERRLITLGEISRAILAMNTPDTGGKTVSTIAQTVIHPVWLDLQENCLAHLDRLSVEDLCTRALQQGMPSEIQDRLDYSI